MDEGSNSLKRRMEFLRRSAVAEGSMSRASSSLCARTRDADAGTTKCTSSRVTSGTASCSPAATMEWKSFSITKLRSLVAAPVTAFRG
eukprot:CAMPEP_0185213918 /NCGR_PEP_ID=MMETSP1140-20130426/68272_1 /TAXON_ID=298111 /ORGANISM="Pavlova sp., Strain CCMP459" /LENGTH=87 /DNA_ID=CAMNT_0027781775 /DNA_START=12 /DNA_END=275 /DNA_ORIENTATION=-